jgi:hypothetical protein
LLLLCIGQVALLFLVKDAIPNELIWRAFFEAAATLQLQPHLAPAAAAAAQQAAAASIADLIGNKTLHPALEAYEPWIYPGFRIQHGLSPGADAPSARPHGSYKYRLVQQQAALNAPQPRHIVINSSSSSSGSNIWLHRQQHKRQTEVASVNGGLQFPAAALSWEQPALREEMQRLLRLSPQQNKASSYGSIAWPTRQQQQQIEAGQGYKHQLSTVQEAVSYEERQAAAAAGQPAAGSFQQQQQDGSSSSSTDSRVGPLHTLLAQQQLFSVYVHTTNGVLLPPSSIFSGCELRVRLNTTRGYAQHMLAEAEVLLLRAALGDAANAKFVMVSDSSIPLYPPQVSTAAADYCDTSAPHVCVRLGDLV